MNIGRLIATLRVSAVLTLLGSAVLPAGSRAQQLRIDAVIVATTVAPGQRDAETEAAKKFYEFWNTGNETFLAAAISPAFVDHTLPPGRPQGPSGPASASRNFRQAVPDLTVEIRRMIVADDYVTVHMAFKGHFTGTFGPVRGRGQVVNFIATDLLKVANGRVTDNWHIEDNFTLFSQMGVASVRQ